MAIFGLFEGTVVLPTIQFYAGTLLAEQTYKVPESAMSGMNLDLGDTSVPGGAFASDTLFNCPFGRDNPDSQKCRMYVSHTYLHSTQRTPLEKPTP